MSLEALELPGIRRIGTAEWINGERPEPGEAFWVDQVLYDIPNTVEMAVRNGHRCGARAVTLFTPLTVLFKYRPVIAACRELKMIIVVANTPDFRRGVWWQQ